MTTIRLYPIIALLAAAAAGFAAETSVIPAPDHSYAPEKYQQAGLPSLAAAWTEDQCLAVISSLVAIAKSDVTALPRYRSKVSGKTFERLTDSAGFARPPTNQAPQDAILFRQVYVNAIAKVYLNFGLAKGYGFDVELAVLTEKQLDLQEQILSVLKAGLAPEKVAATDRELAARLQQITPQLLLSSVTTLTDPGLHPDARTVYMRFFPEVGRRLARHLTNQQRVQLEAQIRPLVAKMQKQRDAAAILEILAPPPGGKPLQEGAPVRDQPASRTPAPATPAAPPRAAP